MQYGIDVVKNNLSSLLVRSLLSLVFVMANVTLSDAQLIAPTDQQELRYKQQREQQEHERQQNAPDARLQKEKAAMDSFDLPAESPCFQIKAIVVEGDKDKNFPWAKKYVGRYENRCIGRDGINLIVKRLTNQFIERGFVTTRVGIPEQDIASGTLRLLVIPGVIRSMGFTDEHLWGTWKTAFPIRSGELLDLRHLEQGLEQMKRVPYQDIDLDIKPGGLPGESDVNILVKRQKPWRASVSFDDSGSQTSGKFQGTASLSWDNPLGINDLLSGSYSHDLSPQKGRGTYGTTVFYSVPYGYWTMTVDYSDNSYYQTVTGLVENFVYSGTSTQVGARIQRLIHRDQLSKTTLEIGLNKRWAETYLNDIEVEVQRRNTTEVQAGISHRRYLGSAMLDFALTHRQGVPWLNAESDLQDSAPDSVTTRYQIQTLDVSLNLPFKLWDIPLRYLAHSRAQYTQDKILATEQFSIGSRYTVRGFDGEQMLIAERGWYIRNDLGIPLGKTAHEFYIGIDHGDVDGPSTEMLAGTSLTGGVVGLRGSFDGGKFGMLAYDVFAGWPIMKPSRLQTAEPAAGFQVTYQF